VPTVENNDVLRLYPNPFSNDLHISSTTQIQRVFITSSLGQVVANYELNNANSQTINTSSLNNGLYFVTVVDKDGKRQVQKLIKK
jgi:hypothetical protein